MKKFLLSMSAAMACMTMSAAVPTLTEQFKGVIEATQETPNYSNPSAYDADGNLIITGAFNNKFGELEAIGTSAYIVKYDKNNGKQWTVALIGSATITAIDTDTAGNIYVAGTLADEVEFGTTSGDAIIKAGMSDGAGGYTVGQNASFIAKYDSAGKAVSVETFVPSNLPDLKEKYDPEDGDVYFSINHVKVYGGKVYASARYTGLTEKDGVSFEGSYYDAWGMGFAYYDMAGASVFSMSDALANCTLEADFRIKEPVMFAMERAYSVAFDVNENGLIAGFVGSGNFNVKNGDNSYELSAYADGDTGNNEYGFVLITSNSGVEPIVLRTKSMTSKVNNMHISALNIDGNSLYMVGAYAGSGDAPAYMPALVLPDGDGEMPTNTTRIFVSKINLSDFSFVASVGYDHDAGKTDEYNNYEIANNVGVVDGALYINSLVCNDHDETVVGNSSCWFDGSAFSDAPVAATGIAVGDGVVALVSSDATKADYSTYTFNPTQSGISGIEADFDENAPVEYFNLQGIRVANPESGLYIRRQGNKVEKVIL